MRKDRKKHPSVCCRARFTGLSKPAIVIMGDNATLLSTDLKCRNGLIMIIALNSLTKLLFILFRLDSSACDIKLLIVSKIRAIP